jgi:hypothetical protein
VFRNRERALKIFVWIVVLSMVLTVVASLAAVTLS